jgi:hypothetical protein
MQLPPSIMMRVHATHAQLLCIQPPEQAEQCFLLCAGLPGSGLDEDTERCGCANTQADVKTVRPAGAIADLYSSSCCCSCTQLQWQGHLSDTLQTGKAVLSNACLLGIDYRHVAVAVQAVDLQHWVGQLYVQIAALWCYYRATSTTSATTSTLCYGTCRTASGYGSQPTSSPAGCTATSGPGTPWHV